MLCSLEYTLQSGFSHGFTSVLNTRLSSPLSLMENGYSFFFPIQTGCINHNISLCKTWGIVNSLNTLGILGRREIEDKKRRLERKLAEIY